MKPETYEMAEQLVSRHYNMTDQTTPYDVGVEAPLSRREHGEFEGIGEWLPCLYYASPDALVAERLTNEA